MVVVLYSKLENKLYIHKASIPDPMPPSCRTVGPRGERGEGQNGSHDLFIICKKKTKMTETKRKTEILLVCWHVFVFYYNPVNL